MLGHTYDDVVKSHNENPPLTYKIGSNRNLKLTLLSKTKLSFLAVNKV